MKSGRYKVLFLSYVPHLSNLFLCLSVSLQRYQKCQYHADARRSHQVDRFWLCHQAVYETESERKSPAEVTKRDAILDGT